MALDIDDFNNAELDLKLVQELATSTELEATDRFGTTKKTWAGIEQDLGAKYAETVTGQNRIATENAAALAQDAAVDAQASSSAVWFTTKTLMDATSPKAVGSRAVVYKDSTPANNGYYTSNGTAFVLDNLQPASAAKLNTVADAQQLKADVAPGKNLFNPADPGVQVGYAIDGSPSGAGNPFAVGGFRATPFIKVLPNAPYSVSHLRGYAWFDAAHQYISGSAVSTGAPASLGNSPSNAVYYRTGISDGNLPTFQFEKGAAPTSWQAYKVTLTSPLAASAVATANLADGSVAPSKTSFMRLGKNLFDKSVVLSDYYLGNDGGLVANASYEVSDFIAVSNAPFAYSTSEGLGVRFTTYFDANQGLLAGGAAFPGGSVSGNFTPPVGVAFVKITIYKTSHNRFQFEAGSVPTDFAEYGYVVKPENLPPVEASTSAPEVVVPPYIFGVQGRECNVYFENLYLAAAADYLQDVNSAGNTGAHQNERWTWTPSGALTSGTLTINTHDKRTGTLLVGKTVQQRAAASNAGAGQTKKILVIGDSLIGAGVITQTLLDIAATDVMGVSLLGTQGTGANRHEGRGGWNVDYYTGAGPTYYDLTVSDVNTPPQENSTTYSHNGSVYRVQVINLTGGAGTLRFSVVSGGAPLASGTLTKTFGTGDASIAFSASAPAPGNPFFIGGALNFGQYLTNNAIVVPDWVFIHLLINDLFDKTSDALASSAADTALTKLDTLIASIKAAGAGIKVGLMIPPPPSFDQDAFGASYGTGVPRWRDKRNILIGARQMIAKYSGQEANRIYLVPTNTALDTQRMQLGPFVPANSRMPAVRHKLRLAAAPDTVPQVGAVYVVKDSPHRFAVASYEPSEMLLSMSLVSATSMSVMPDAGTLTRESGVGSNTLAFAHYGADGGIRRMVNGVHPPTPGYQQESDSLWAFLKFNA